MTALRRLARCRRGVSTLEMGVLAPIMLVMAIGTAEVGNIMAINRRLTAVAATAADLTADFPTVDAAILNEIYGRAEGMLSPFDPNRLHVVVSSVSANSLNVGKIAWSCARRATARPTASNYPVPASKPGAAAVLVEVSYDYVPILSLPEFVPTVPATLRRTVHVAPRKSAKVTKSGGCP